MNLEKLLDQKDFDMLSSQQQVEVLLHLNKDEYNRMRQAHLLARATFSKADDDLLPDSKILKNLKQQMKHRRKVKGFGLQLIEKLNYRLPAYQAVAAAVLLAFGLHFLSGSFKDHSESLISPVMFADSTTSKTSPQGKFSPDEDTVKDDTMLRLNDGRLKVDG